MATTSYKSFNGGVIPEETVVDNVKNKFHRIALWDVSSSDPTPRPLESWVIDLEDPNTSEPSGYSKLTVAKANEIHRNGEIFALRTEPIQNPYTSDLLVETYFESPSGTNLTIKLSKVSDKKVLTEYVISDYDQFAGVSEHSEFTIRLRRYSHAAGTVDGETPVYGSWLIDLDKPDPNGPEGYSRVSPADFWKSLTVDGEVPVYLQDRNINSTLAYAYLSRADVSKDGSTITAVNCFFVRPGAYNRADTTFCVRYTVFDGSTYIQKDYEKDFVALSESGDSGNTEPTFSMASTVGNIVSGTTLSTILGKIAKWFDYGMPLMNGGSFTNMAAFTVKNNKLSSLVNMSQTAIEIDVGPLTVNEFPNFVVEIDNTSGVDATITVKILRASPYQPFTLMFNSSAGNQILAGKLYQLTCVGSFWTLAEFALPNP